MPDSLAIFHPSVDSRVRHSTMGNDAIQLLIVLVWFYYYSHHGSIECLPTVGCRKWSSAASAVQPESVESSDSDGPYLDSDGDHDEQIKYTKRAAKSDHFAESDRLQSTPKNWKSGI